VILGLETSDAVMARIGPLLIAINTAILGVFVVEIAIKLVRSVRASSVRAGTSSTS
jgi:voltage-gated sodium channel